MKISVSGTNEAACRTWLDAGSWGEHTLAWCAPDTLHERAADGQVVWLYQPPWLAVLDDVGEATPAIGEVLTHWAQACRAVLGLRQEFAANLLLVNTEHMSAAQLRTKLDGSEHADATTPRAAADLNHPAAPLLGQLFNEAAPQYWDILEAMEAACWLPAGAEPMFRNSATVDEKQLITLLDVLRTGPRMRAEHDRLSDELKQARAAGHELRKERDDLKQESELLLVQLHQVQEELEQYYLRNVELEKEAEQATKTHTTSGKALADARQANKALKVQLREMQDALDREKDARDREKAAPAVSLAPATTAVNVTPRKRISHLVPAPARKVLGRPRVRRLRQRQIDAIRKSRWFDSQWYLNHYADVRTNQVDPAEHYFTTGWKENRDPSDSFNTAYYLRTNPDIAQSGLNPLWHFIEFGRQEGRRPSKA